MSKLYAALFLDDRSKTLLRRWWELVVKVPFLDQIWLDHVTVCYDPDYRELKGAQELLGRTFHCDVKGYAISKKVQAVAITPYFWCPRKYPHVTIATAPGVDPVESNNLLARGVKSISGPNLVGTIDLRDD